MIAFPAIDLIGGSLVRLEKGDYSTKRGFGVTPLEAAKAFEGAGLKHLHLVDLDAAKGDGNNLRVLEELSSRTGLIIDFGGGLRTLKDVERAFSAGADSVNLGSVAVKAPEEVEAWGRMYPGRIILSADVRGRKVAVHGWQEDTEVEVVPLVKRFLSSGIDRAAVTDIAADGMLSGPNTGLYREILGEVPGLRLIASGGVSCREDLEALSECGCYAAIVGKAYYTGKVTLEDLVEVSCCRKG